MLLTSTSGPFDTYPLNPHHRLPIKKEIWVTPNYSLSIVGRSLSPAPSRETTERSLTADLAQTIHNSRCTWPIFRWLQLWGYKPLMTMGVKIKERCGGNLWHRSIMHRSHWFAYLAEILFASPSLSEVKVIMLPCVTIEDDSYSELAACEDSGRRQASLKNYRKANNIPHSQNSGKTE